MAPTARDLALAEPQLPLIIREKTTAFQHLAGTRDKQGVLKLLLDIMESITNPDPVLRERLQELVFQEVCAELGIERCVLKEAQKMLNRCCRDKCSCFSATS